MTEMELNAESLPGMQANNVCVEWPAGPGHICNSTIYRLSQFMWYNPSLNLHFLFCFLHFSLSDSFRGKTSETTQYKIR